MVLFTAQNVDPEKPPTTQACHEQVPPCGFRPTFVSLP